MFFEDFEKNVNDIAGRISRHLVSYQDKVFRTELRPQTPESEAGPVADPDLEIRGAGGGGRGHPDLEIRRGWSLF